MTEAWAIALVVVSGIFGALGPIFLKRGADNISFKTLHKNYNLMYGVLLYGLGLIIFTTALTGGELSVLYPIVGLSYVWVCLYSVWLLKEKMNKYKWTGIFLILIGVALLGV